MNKQKINTQKINAWTNDMLLHPDNEYIVNAYDYRCVIRKTKLYTWNGYVIIGPNHAYFKKSDEYLINVHGGITYIDKDNGIIGFNCAHVYDSIPTQHDLYNMEYDDSKHYWTFDEVLDETLSLAKQMKEYDEN